MKDLINVNYDNNRITVLARDLHEFLEIATDFRHWFPRMCEYGFEESIDYTPVIFDHPQNGQPTKDYQLTIEMAKEIAMIQRNEKGKQARQYFIECENQLKQTAIEMNNLSPELRFLINVEMQQKEQQKQIDDVKSDLQGIRDTILLSPSTWRTDTSKMITRIAQKLGGNEYIQTVREESYKLLEERAHVALSIRLSNIRKTMAENGVCKSKRDKLNKVDVIERDPKVLECYLAIVKEMAIKYGVS